MSGHLRSSLGSLQPYVPSLQPHLPRPQSSYVSRLQPCVLQVGVRPALAMVRTHRSRITSMFVFGLLCFFLSAIATVSSGSSSSSTTTTGYRHGARS